MTVIDILRQAAGKGNFDDVGVTSYLAGGTKTTCSHFTNQGVRFDRDHDLHYQCGRPDAYQAGIRPAQAQTGPQQRFGPQPQADQGSRSTVAA